MSQVAQSPESECSSDNSCPAGLMCGYSLIYTYPKPKSKKILNRWKGFWKKGSTIVSTNLHEWKLPNEYNKRTEFVGKLQWHNCTMLLDGVRKTDVDPSYFRIEMPQYKSFSYINNTVSINVLSEY